MQKIIQAMKDNSKVFQDLIEELGEEIAKEIKGDQTRAAHLLEVALQISHDAKALNKLSSQDEKIKANFVGLASHFSVYAHDIVLIIEPIIKTMEERKQKLLEHRINSIKSNIGSS